MCWEVFSQKLEQPGIVFPKFFSDINVIVYWVGGIEIGVEI